MLFELFVCGCIFSVLKLHDLATNSKCTHLSVCGRNNNKAVFVFQHPRLVQYTLLFIWNAWTAGGSPWSSQSSLFIITCTRSDHQALAQGIISEKEDTLNPTTSYWSVSIKLLCLLRRRLFNVEIWSNISHAEDVYTCRFHTLWQSLEPMGG